MPDFSSLLKKTSGEAKAPALLPGDDYPAVVKKYEFGDANKNKTPYLRVFFGLTGPGFGSGSQEALSILGIDDPTKRQIRRDFYLRGRDPNDAEAAERSMYYLDEFLRACGVATGGSYDETIPQITGAQVLITVTEKLNEDTNLPYREITKVSPLS